MEERRIVTVLFCDIVGSTSIASDVDAEEWAEVVREVFPLMIDPVEHHGGTIARLMGDGALAFFGAPTARADDPQRAILAALEIQRGMANHRDRLRREYGCDIDVRVGINSGTVVTGEFGSESAREYTALGDTVNIAARMEQTAEPGTVQITAETYRLALPYFEFQPLGLVEVKGKPEGVEAYRVLRRLSGVGRQRGLQDFAGPLVGRDRELGLLRYWLNELDAGRGGVVAVIAEAGLGKSRLIEELRRDWIEDRGHQQRSWIEDQLVSFEETTPYGMVLRRLARDLDLQDGVAPTTIRDRLGAILTDCGAEERDHAVRAVGHLFSSDHGESEQSTSSSVEDAADLRQELVLVLDHIWRARTDHFGSCVYVMEDFHWIDSSSAQLVEHLVPVLLNLPVLLILTFRPEHESPFWEVHERLAARMGIQYLSLSLVPLPQQDSGALIDALLPGAEFPTSLRQTILERIAGNPLFAGEIVRSLVEHGFVTPVTEPDMPGWKVATDLDLTAIEIPTSLQALVQERVDLLDAGTKRTLQLASIVGRTFQYDELLEVIGDPATLDSHLADLQGAMLVHPDSYAGAGGYVFHHALIWEAVYRSMVRRTLERLHLRVGEALERLHVGEQDEYAGPLAQHFAVARDARSVTYAERAGVRAQALFAPQEAAEHFTRALRAAEDLDQPPPPRLLRQRGRAYEIRGNFDAARRDYDAALELSRTGGDPREEWETLVDIGRSWEGLDYDLAGTWFERALALARRLDNPRALAESLNRVGNWYTNTEQMHEARPVHLEALTIFEELGDEPGVAATHDYLGMVALLAGDPIETRERFEKAVEIFERRGNLRRLASTLAAMATLSGSYLFDTVSTASASPVADAEAWGLRALRLARETGWRAGEAFALMTVSGLYISVSRYDEAFRLSDEGIEISTEIAHHEWLTGITGLRGYLLTDILALDRAVDTIELSTRLAIESGSRYMLHFNTGFLLNALVDSGHLDRADEVFSTLASDLPMRSIGKNRIWLGRARWLLANGELESALDVLDRLLGASPNFRTQADIPLVAWRRGLVLIELGRTEEALEALLAAEQGVKRLEWMGSLWKIRVDLARLLHSCGRDEEASAALREAQAIVARIAPRIPDDEGLRANFLTASQAMCDEVEINPTFEA